MKNLVRGGVILSMVGMLVVFIYAQAKTETALKIATNSQIQLNITESNLESNKALEAQGKKKEDQIQENQTQESGKKLVEKTVSSKAAGINKGSFTATAYCLRGRTASGAGVRRGHIAADRRVIPLGSRINLGAGSYSGNYLVADTGGKIKGRRLDIWMASCSEARRFGRRKVNVTLLP